MCLVPVSCGWPFLCRMTRSSCVRPSTTRTRARWSSWWTPRTTSTTSWRSTRVCRWSTPSLRRSRVRHSREHDPGLAHSIACLFVFVCPLSGFLRSCLARGGVRWRGHFYFGVGAQPDGVLSGVCARVCVCLCLPSRRGHRADADQDRRGLVATRAGPHSGTALATVHARVFGRCGMTKASSSKVLT